MKIILLLVGVGVLMMTTILPMFLLERTNGSGGGGGQISGGAHISLHDLMAKSAQLKQMLEEKKLRGQATGDHDVAVDNQHMKINAPDLPMGEDHQHHHVVDASTKATTKNEEDVPQLGHGGKETPDPLTNHHDNESGNDNTNAHPNHYSPPPINKNILARGVSGLPLSKTPALIGAKWGHVECDVDVDDFVYWNDPQGTRDQQFVSPFAEHSQSSGTTRYLTFEPDPGGWNNIRMSMEIIFVMAAATGRTLVLPPKAPFYLLGTGKENARSFASFYDISKEAFQNKVKVISMEEFLEEETKEGGLLGFLSDEEKTDLKPVSETCIYQKDSPILCEKIWQHLRRIGFQPPIGASKQCFVFDHDIFEGQDVTDDLKERVDRFCGEERKPVYYNQTIHEPRLIHWDASAADGNGVTGFRLLNHFYSFLFFTDPMIDNFYKRFVRDFLHYKDSLYCAAGKVVHALNAEGKEWSTMHVRRGDLQYKAVKISAEEWYENLKEIWNEGEMIFIATDERNKTFFDPLKEHHELRFLDDYWDVAKLGDLDPYFLGMVDTIVASHGRTFAGTWFSTFTAFINRMRGYLGYSMMDSWYGWLPRKDSVREYKYPTGNYGAREWPIGWIAIDGDEVIEHEGTPVLEEELVQENNAGGPKRKVRSTKSSI
jgi:GDP-fucose protein O-fucosyltransferase